MEGGGRELNHLLSLGNKYKSGFIVNLPVYRFNICRKLRCVVLQLGFCDHSCALSVLITAYKDTDYKLSKGGTFPGLSVNVLCVQDKVWH
jgi:hypothetical protein